MMWRYLAILFAIFAAISSRPGDARAVPRASPGVEGAMRIYFECRGRSDAKSGRRACEAMGRHELGLSMEQDDPARAAALFESAIALDPSFEAAYFSLARAALDRGSGGAALFVKVKKLLSRAPRTPELDRLRARLTGWRETNGTRY